MIVTSAIAGLQESIQQTESALSSLDEQKREKRAELRRYHKALSALTGQALIRRRKKRAPDSPSLDLAPSPGE